MKGMSFLVEMIIAIVIITIIALVYMGIASGAKAQATGPMLESLILQNCKAWSDAECDPNMMSMISVEDENGKTVSLQYLCQQAFGENYLKGCTCRCCIMDEMCREGS
jgi:hypothetical protein